jgi:large subunit ribosomal protein L29
LRWSLLKHLQRSPERRNLGRKNHPKERRRVAILRSDEIRDMNIDEMKAKLMELRSELARERAIIASGGSLENPGRVRELKHSIARLLTIIKQTQKKGGARTSAGSV